MRRQRCQRSPPLLDLLRFIYSGTLPFPFPFPTTRNPSALLNLLVAADKFEVTSRVSYRVTLLLRLPMSSDTALVYLDLPSSVSSTDESRPLVSAAVDYLVAHHKNFDKGADFQRLSVAGLETVLRRDDLRPDSEDEVFDAVLKWGRFNFPDLDERRRVLASLKDVLRCDDLDRDFTTRVVQDALFFKAWAVSPRADDRRFIARDYKRKLMRMFKADRPCKHCVMYFDLKWEECLGLAPLARIYSEAFRLGGHVFCLSAGRKGLDEVLKKQYLGYVTDGNEHRIGLSSCGDPAGVRKQPVPAALQFILQPNNGEEDTHMRQRGRTAPLHGLSNPPDRDTMSMTCMLSLSRASVYSLNSPERLRLGFGRFGKVGLDAMVGYVEEAGVGREGTRCVVREGDGGRRRGGGGWWGRTVEAAGGEGEGWCEVMVVEEGA
ncbi:BTB/POZ domain-containing protein [Acorus calamus]|uniref:BTB/POZ domain-containing protein n=1 Tax=Acorus calamus TaxID=4465 RepID=A0AAV9F4M2_ACOCL|nr:BTB/POZ domain-containing protein [Acorus calamus]